jgi:hypothetical protein
VLPLMLGRSDDAARLTVRGVQTCLMELVEFARDRTSDDSVLCEVWLDQQHVFVSIEHTQPACTEHPFSCHCDLSTVASIADDHGTHQTQDGYQTWAAIRKR